MFKTLRIPIVVKLVGVTVGLLLVATGWIAIRSSELFQEISAPREKDANGIAAEAKAAQIDLLFENYIEKTRLVADQLLRNSTTATEENSSLGLSFFQDRDFVNLSVYELINGRQQKVSEISKASHFTKNKVEANYIEQLRVAKPLPLNAAFSGQIKVQNSSLSGGLPLLTLLVPFGKNDQGVISHVAVADIRLDGIQKPFSKVTERSYFMVGSEGHVLAHPDEKLVFDGTELAHLGIVQKALSSQLKKGESRYVDPNTNEAYIASFAQTRFGPAIIAQASEAVILEPAQYVKREAFYVTGLVLSGALFFVFLFSVTLTSPIERLVEVTRQIASGNFEVHSNVTSHDEVGELANSIDNMVDGLRERDKMKNVLNKFHGENITEDLMKGELELGGTRKEVTVFFSDIRDFTKFSEGQTPEAVVEMLNEYFEVMVGIITKNHGVVDKFVGDAIMAVWGAPNFSEEDPRHAVKACLEIRQALAHLNERRIERGQTPIRIGMGLNSGEAISGTIGSSERMEYTVIGDSVNTAARIEASTKAFGTDLLISGSTLEAVSGHFVTEKAGEAEVKGKSKPLEMHRVLGYVGENEESILVKTPYSEFEPAHDDKVKVA